MTQEWNVFSDLFNQFVNIYLVDGNSFTTVKAKYDAGRINSINETFQEFKSFQPSFLGVQNIGVHPMQHVSVNPMMYYGSPGEPMKYNTTRDSTILQKKLLMLKLKKIVFESTLIIMGKINFLKLIILDNIIWVHKHIQ